MTGFEWAGPQIDRSFASSFDSIATKHTRSSAFYLYFSKWNKHLQAAKKFGKKPSLLRVLVATFWPEYLSLGFILATMDIGVRLTQPILLGYLLDHFRTGSDVTKEKALMYAGALVALNAVSALFINQYIMGAFHYGMRVRAACCALIYRKVRGGIYHAGKRRWCGPFLEAVLGNAWDLGQN